jgi:hypothetical protein
MIALILAAVSFSSLLQEGGAPQLANAQQRSRRLSGQTNLFPLHLG